MDSFSQDPHQEVDAWLEPGAPNHEVYERLSHRWYDADDDPIALLRAEARLRNPWILGYIRKHFKQQPVRLLDLGCGGGFLSNFMSENGIEVVGVDASEDAIAIARQHDSSGQAHYALGDCMAMDFPDQSFDVVCAMDLLEHVEAPHALVAEASRLLRPGGLFFFYTFNRNWLSNWIVIWGVERVVRNVPENLHVYDYFITPEEMRAYCQEAGLRSPQLFGMAPRVLSASFVRLLCTGVVPKKLAFRFTRSTRLAYLGLASKKDNWNA